MIYTIFTCSRDELLLTPCINGIKSVDANAKIALVHDTNDRLTSTHDVDFVIASTFERKGNLNGITCVQGMLQVMKDLLAQTEESHVCKLDSDTLLLKVPPVGASYWGAEMNQTLKGAGLCYTISAKGVDDMLAFIDGRSWVVGGEPESVLISTIGLACGGSLDASSQNRFSHIFSFDSEYLANFKSSLATSLVALHFGLLKGHGVTQTAKAQAMDYLITKL